MIKEMYKTNVNRKAAAIVEAKPEENNCLFTLKDEKNEKFYLELKKIKDNVLRISVSRPEPLKDNFSLVNPDFIDGGVEPALKVKQNNGDYLLDAGRIKANLTADPFSFQIRDEANNLLYEEVTDDFDSVGPGENLIPSLGHTLDQKSGEVISTNLATRIRYDEHFYGMGEQFGNFDKLGGSFRMWNSDTLGCRDELSYKNIPFYYSSAGYGLYIDSTAAVEFNFGTESNAVLSMHIPEPQTCFYLISGQVREVISTYMQMTGPAALPPQWSFGLWYSTGFKDADEKQVIKQAEKFRELDIPCDVFHFDCYWLREDKWCDFVWNDEKYPHKEKMIHRLQELGYKTCLWINPYVTNQTEMYTEGDKKGYFLKTPEGRTYLADMWHGLLSPCAILDVTNSEAVAWFRQKLKSALDDGINVLKTDFGEDIPEDSCFANGKTGREMRNLYSYLYNMIVFAVIEETNHQGIVWARSGTAGMQRYPVCWSGDPRSTFAGMAATLRGGLSMAMSGVPFWSNDIGGFYGECSDEIYTRWAQFGLFVSHSRFHGTSKRQPWAFADRTYKTVKSYIKIRYQLMQYILKTAETCVNRGNPFIRPLVYSFSDPNVYTIWDEYMFGDEILVAPVFSGDKAKRLVYLPGGTWQDMLTSEIYDGGKWYSFYCPLEYIPVFKRGESDIKLDCPDDIAQTIRALPRAREVMPGDK